MYQYRISKESIVKYGVYDGDTFRANIDLGFGVWLSDQRFRLYGVNAPELRGTTLTQAQKCRDTFKSKMLSSPGDYLYLQSLKDSQEKYGRWLAVVYRTIQDITTGESVSINQELLRDATLGYTVMIY